MSLCVSGKARIDEDHIGVTRRAAARRVARMSQLRYQAYCPSASVFARIGPTVDRGPRAGRATLTGTWIWLVITRYLPSRTRPLHLYPLVWYQRAILPADAPVPLRRGAAAARPRSRTSCNQNYVRADHVIRGSPHVAGRFTRM